MSMFFILAVRGLVQAVQALLFLLFDILPRGGLIVSSNVGPWLRVQPLGVKVNNAHLPVWIHRAPELSQPALHFLIQLQWKGVAVQKTRQIHLKIDQLCI